MKNKFLPILGVCLLTGPQLAVAELVESSTGVMLTFRPCDSGATVCDSIGPPQVSRYGGLPGELSAIARHVDSNYGEASGSAKIHGAAGCRTDERKLGQFAGHTQRRQQRHISALHEHQRRRADADLQRYPEL